MRSASSTCAGRPEAMRPATYFTSGEYATTRRSRAAWSPDPLYRRHRSLSSMALTLVSTACLPQPLSARMCPLIGLFEPRGLYPSVDLRRGDTCMSEHLLDCPQVGAAVEEVGCERMTQRMRMDASLDGGVPRPHAKATPNVGGREPPPGLREEQSLLTADIRQGRARALGVARKGTPRRLAGGDDPGLGALAFHTYLFRLVVDRADVELDQLLGAESARVRELEHGTVGQIQPA